MDYYYYYYLEIFTSASADGFSLDFVWPHVSMTLLSILAVFNNAVVWMVSTRLPKIVPLNYIRWSVCMSKSCRSSCVSDRCRVVNIPFVRMVKFKFLEHIPLDYLVHPVVSSLVLFLCLICCILLLCDWSFHLCHRIAYICYFVASYLFSLWYDWFLCRCFMLQLGEILFLS